MTPAEQDTGDTLPHLPKREADSHKGDYGRVLLVGGSRGMAGAAALAGMAAQRSGAGLVKVATADRCLETVALYEPSYTTYPLPDDERGRITEEAFDDIRQLSEWADCVAIGPGLGLSEPLTRLVNRLFRELPSPMVLDADALNALAAGPGWNVETPDSRVLTPHVGELRRLLGSDNDRDQLLKEARAVANERLVVLVKGSGTYITNGVREATNTSGNPGMATGGSGDVLTGVIAALIGQGFAPFDAARLGAHIHGAAGDLAAQEHGEVAMIASDMIDCLSDIDF